MHYIHRYNVYTGIMYAQVHYNCERETCSLCSKFIYKHQPVVVRSSGTIPDWICPTCSREVFPCYDDIPNLSYVKLKCVCFNCRLSRGESGLTLSFNLFNLDSDDNFNTFDDSMWDTLNCANTILQSCCYYERVNRVNEDDSLSKFYFNNIDGFRTNFNESLINIKLLNCVPSLIAFCETNLLYSHKTNLFRRISSFTIRNKFFECIGGSLETEYKELIFITVYRFHGNESEFLEHFMKIILPYKDKPLLILGDFNLNLFEYDNNTNIDDFVNGMISNSLFPLVNKATNFFRGSSTLIDHAWTNILNNSTKCDVVDILTFKSNRNKYDKPRITTGLAKACKVKSKLHNKWIKSRGTMNENAAKTNYKSYRSKLKKLIQQAELNYFKNKFNNASGNIRKTFFNFIPSLISFCETNLDEDDIHDFNMTDYNAEHLYAIPGKKKGSGLSIYSHKIYLFRRISSLTIRNKFFECIGGSLAWTNILNNSTKFDVANILVATNHYQALYPLNLRIS